MNSSEDEDKVTLWEREENPLLCIQLTDENVLSVRQYISHDDRWGIYSQVWDGGIAMVKYLIDSGIHGTCLDLGSGTGIVGLAFVKCRPHCRAVLTDLAEALELLQENVNLNFANDNNNLMVCELVWGQEIFSNKIFQVLLSEKDIVVTGADIVYRRTIMQPLLKTLKQIIDLCPKAKLILSIQSIRTHMDEFLELALSQGWIIDFKANVTVVNESQATIDYTSIPVKSSPGVVNIFEMTRNG